MGGMRGTVVRSWKKGGSKFPRKQLPVIVEKDEDGFYVAECPVLRSCYTQGKTIDEALHHIREVIALLLEEDEAQATLEAYLPTETSLHAITL